MKNTRIKSGYIIGRDELKRIKGGDDGGFLGCKTEACTLIVDGCVYQAFCETHTELICVCKGVCGSPMEVNTGCRA